MNLGISTYTFPWAVAAEDSRFHMSMESLFAIAKKHKVSSIQIADNYPLDKLSKPDLLALAAKAVDDEIRLEVGTRRLESENIINYLRIAKLVKSPFLRVVIDDHQYEPSVEDVIQIINNLLPTLSDLNVILAIENHDRFSSAELTKIIEMTSREHVGICLDTANSLGAGEGVNEVLAHLAPYCVNLHIKDINIRRLSHKMGFKVLGSAAGDGDLDIPLIIEKVKNNGKLRSITLEVWSDECPTQKETIDRERRWAEKSIRYLKTIIK